MDDNGYPWTRRATESNPAYEAFRIYMKIRSTTKVAGELEKSITLITRWCTDHEWVSRVAAYDTFLMEEQTAAAADWISESRTETQKLADKLRGLLSERLDHCIASKQDPTVRWSQACTVLLKMQDSCVIPVENAKVAAELDRVAKLLEKVTGEQVTA